MRAILLAIGLSLCMLGCELTFRSPAREATLGALDALESPPRDAVLARKLGLVLDRFLEKALSPEVPPTVEEISRDAARGAVQGLTGVLPDPRGMLRGIVSGSISAAAEAIDDERRRFGRIAAHTGEQAVVGVVRGMHRREGEAATLAGQLADAAGRAAARGVTEETIHQMERWFGRDAEGPLAEGLAAAAERSVAAAVRGLTLALAAEIERCPGPPGQPCLQDVARILSRSAARGASEGVQRGISPLVPALAFVAGLIAAVLAGWILQKIRERRRPPPPQPT